MKKSAITKTLKKVEAEDKKYSLGFIRKISLPTRVARSMQTAYLLKFKEVQGAHKYICNFLENLTEKEFKTWMLVQ